MSFDREYALQIDQLNSANVLTGKELLLIQSPDNVETQNITVDLLLANFVNLLNKVGTFAVEEYDPTVPSFVKGITEEDIANWRANVKDVERLKDQVSRLQDSTLKITAFNVHPNVVEIGTVLNTITIKWDTNFRVLVSQSIDGVEIPDLTKRERSLDGPFSQSQSFTLEVTGDDGTVDTRIADLKFLNGVYYGASTLHEIDSDFIKSLNKTLTDNRILGFTVVSREQEYIYVAIPARFGNPNFEIISEIADFDFIKEIEFENSSGYVEDYYVFRTVNVHLGQTTIRLS